MISIADEQAAPVNAFLTHVHAPSVRPSRTIPFANEKPPPDPAASDGFLLSRHEKGGTAGIADPTLCVGM